MAFTLRPTPDDDQAIERLRRRYGVDSKAAAVLRAVHREADRPGDCDLLAASDRLVAARFDALARLADL